MARATLGAVVVGTALALSAAPAAAQSIIRQPGQHQNHVEVEVHGIAAYAHSYGLGAGFRIGIPIVQNGFVQSINNSVAINFGADFVHFPDFGERVTGVIIPVMLQWNFFLTQAWSVFGEVGFAPRIWFGTDGCAHCGEAFFPWPGTAVGARYHFRPGGYPTLTMRLGWPTGFNIGVSF